MSDLIKISRLQAFSLRAEVKDVPKSSLGAMTARNGLLVRIENEDGVFGWGEIWCNFPPQANQYRRHLLENVIAPELFGQVFQHHRDVRPALEARWNRMAAHVGEPGPFGHCIAGIDSALWDLQARRAGLPLSAMLASEPAGRVKVYASTLSPDRTADLASKLLEDGHRAFKLKVGRDSEVDENLVRSVRGAIGNDPDIMVDANQSWTVAEAVQAIASLSAHGLCFVEEPISAWAGMYDWKVLSEQSDVPLAAGENICAERDYQKHLKTGALTFYQPDVAKWGGIGGCADVGASVVESGFVYCPHYMGTAIGLAASLHLLAAVGGDGYVELDSNENPLRTELADFNLGVTGGCVRVPEGPGIGIIPDSSELRRYSID